MGCDGSHGGSGTWRKKHSEVLRTEQMRQRRKKAWESSPCPGFNGDCPGKAKPRTAEPRVSQHKGYLAPH